MKKRQVVMCCIMFAIAFSGCVSNEAIIAEISQTINSPGYIDSFYACDEDEEVEGKLDRAISKGERWDAFWGWKTIGKVEERMKFVDCANLTFFLNKEYYPIGTHKDYKGDKDGVIYSRVVKRIEGLLPTATSKQKRRIVHTMIAGFNPSVSSHDHDAREGTTPMNVEFLKKVLSVLDEDEVADHIWKVLGKGYEAENKQEVVDAFLDAFLKKVRSADKLRELVSGGANLKYFNHQQRSRVETALIDKVGQLKNLDGCYETLNVCNQDGLKSYSNPKLIAKMISILPDEKKRDLARFYLDRWGGGYRPKYWWGDPPSYNLLHYAVVCALTTKNTSVAKTISNEILAKLTACRNYTPDNGASWSDVHENKATGLVKKLISVAGEDWLKSVLASKEDCCSFVLSCATSDMANKLLMTNKISNPKTQAALAKIATVDIKKFDEERVAKILSDAKGKGGSTFVLKGFYLGMPINDAHVLLRHYFPESKISLVSDRKTGGTSIEIDPVKSDMAKEGEATDMYFCQADKNGKVFRLNFNKKILKKWFKYDVQTYREWAIMFGQQYKCDFRAYTPEKEYSSGSVFIKVSQEAYRYKNNMKEYVVTYFGKVDVYDPNEKDGWHAVGSGNAQVAREFGVAEGIRQYIYGGGWSNYIGAKEGSLRIEVVKD